MSIFQEQGCNAILNFFSYEDLFDEVIFGILNISVCRAVTYAVFEPTSLALCNIFTYFIYLFIYLFFIYFYLQYISFFCF